MQPTRNNGRREMAEAVGLILASGSRFRRTMLERAGVKFSVVPADVDEGRIKNALLEDDPDIEASVVAARLACEKAVQVSRLHPHALVIGSDQVLVCGGEIFSKPPDLAAARLQLIHLRGFTHALPTAVALAQGGEIVWSHIDEPQMTMRPFSEGFLDDYIAAEGQVLCDTVGAYQFEGRGAQLFEAMEGDMFSVIGLPLLPLLAELRRRGALTN
jgi:septum formation protein